MVIETKSLGDGQPSEGTRNEDIVTVRNIAVYDSHRNIEEWELAFISEQLYQVEKASPKKSMTRDIYEKIQSVIGCELMSKCFKNQKQHSTKLNKSFFKAFIHLKVKQQYHLLRVGHVARMLRSTGHAAIAEKIEP